MLIVEGLSVSVEEKEILHTVDIEVNEGEIHVVFGPNGSGKTSLLMAIMGMPPYRVTEGRILFKGEDVTGKKPHFLSRQGIGYVPDDRRVFADLTVGENLEISERASGESTQWNKESVYEFFPALSHIDSRKAGFLSGGEQQMLTIGRSLMTNPEFLLLDEPTEGLAPMIVKILEEQIRKLRNKGLTVFLAEQNQKVALRLSDRGYIIDNGVIRYQGSIEDLRDNEEVRKKYLLV